MKTGQAKHYLVAVSRHEEASLREAYSDGYEVYLNSGVPFYLPTVDRSGLQFIGAMANQKGERQ